MAKTETKSTSRRLKPHSLLEKLLSTSGGADARVFRGYIGPSTTEGRVRLYPSLGDLTFSIEIPEEDIIDFADAPETLLPYGGVAVWVKHDSEVAFHGRQVTTQAVRSLRRSDPRSVAEVGSLESATPGQFVEVSRGRLQVRVRRRTMDSCASCTCASCGPGCGRCTSTCKSIPSVGSLVPGR